MLVLTLVNRQCFAVPLLVNLGELFLSMVAPLNEPQKECLPRHPCKLDQVYIHRYNLAVNSFFFCLKVGRVWTERLFRQKKKLLGRLFGMQSEVGRVLKKLRFPSIFNADMFLEV